MRFLPALLLIAAPLLAQEPSEEQREEADPEAKLKAEAKQYAERSDDLRRIADQRSKWGMTEEELQRRIEELSSKSEEVRAAAAQALKETNISIDDLLPILSEALEQVRRAEGTIGKLTGPLGARTLWFDSVGSESITGSADGTDYTLKSLGNGMYELHATKKAEDGRLMEEWKDKGTMKELQGKYSFLKSGLAIRVPAAVPGWTALRLADGKELDMTAGRPLAGFASNWGDATLWGGGGMVGVTVVAPSDDVKFHLQLPEGAGFIVQNVTPGSRAEQIGIRRMDILLKLDGELIDTPIQLKKLNERKGVLEIIRRAEAQKIDLATLPAPEERLIPAEKVTEKAAPAPPDGAR